MPLAGSGIPGKQYFGQAFNHPSENVPFGAQAACGMGHGSRPDVLRGWSRWPELLLSDGEVAICRPDQRTKTSIDGLTRRKTPCSSGGETRCGKLAAAQPDDLRSAGQLRKHPGDDVGLPRSTADKHLLPHTPTRPGDFMQPRGRQTTPRPSEHSTRPLESRYEKRPSPQRLARDLRQFEMAILCGFLPRGKFCAPARGQGTPRWTTSRREFSFTHGTGVFLRLDCCADPPILPERTAN